eukprot:TRINITY_DN109844_c0_g1_i1.p1 TRINITY_DN109844_c0_g1~~TRINITY_DN109844_c0_g1_i1.p1  ORF type:complete len:450 (+),score=58.31 TRINITY_DN109844_c0_g1_i1:31-1380(+)
MLTYSWMHVSMTRMLRILACFVFVDLFADAASPPSLECELGLGLLQLESNVAPVEKPERGVWPRLGAKFGWGWSKNDNNKLLQQKLVHRLRNVSLGEFNAQAEDGFVLILVAVVSIVVITALLGWYFRLGNEDEKVSSGAKHQPFVGDTYYAMVASLVRDSQVISTGHYSLQRPVRLVSSVVICFVLMGIQLFILIEVHVQVIDRVVPAINKLYDTYEVTMYSKTHISASGHPRGNAEDFVPLNWLSLSAVVQDEVCSITLANDELFLTILFVWTMSCVVDLRECTNMFWMFVIQAPTVKSLSETVTQRDSEGNVNVAGLTLAMKVFVSVFAILPRWTFDCCLLWMGCTWLQCTTSVSDLILNTVALEFVLHLKKLTFHAFMPQSYRQALKTTFLVIPPERRYHKQLLLEKFSWILLAFTFCCSYIYEFQMVLQDYNWDVQAVCEAVEI